jgi:anti-sigma factor RsiW
MRCVDCLPLIEEYFDGETDERTGERIAAHLASCADCAAALDALYFEQEIYARYDRRLEVAPSLWASVSAEIAREPMPERPATRQNFLGRLRDSVTSSLAALTIRPALASSLALLFVGVVVGSLWLARRPETKDKLVAAANETNRAVAVTPSPVESVAPGNLSREDGNGKSGETVAELGTPAERESKRNVPRPIAAPTPVRST